MTESLGTFDFIAAIVLAVVGCAIVLYLVSLPLAHFGLLYRSGSGKLRLAKAKKRLSLVDAHLQGEAFDQAISELKRAFLIEVLPTNSLIQELQNLHQGIVSRALIVAEHLGGQIENLPDIEHLIHERGELQTLLLRTEEAFRTIAQKRTHAGKVVPSWSKADYQRRAAEITNELKRNGKDLRTVFEQLFSSIRHKESSNITYH